MTLFDSLEKINNGEGDPSCERNRFLVTIVQFVAEQNKPYFIGGGFALVFSSGKIYRCHKDIDIFFLPEDKEFWLRKISTLGIQLLENTDRTGRPIIRMVLEGDKKWVGDIKFVSREDLADDGLPHRVQTNYVGQWVIPTHDPEFNQWQKAWMISKGESREKDFKDLEVYFS